MRKRTGHKTFYADAAAATAAKGGGGHLKSDALNLVKWTGHNTGEEGVAGEEICSRGAVRGAAPQGRSDGGKLISASAGGSCKVLLLAFPRS